MLGACYIQITFLWVFPSVKSYLTVCRLEKFTQTLDSIHLYEQSELVM